jgi:two-component system, NtrC family, sensor kinase
MKKSIYRNLRRKIVTITLLVSFAPLVILGAFIYFQFAAMYRNKVEEQIRYRANAQGEAVDLFLKERTAILSAMADTHKYEDIIDERNLSQILEVMNLRAGAFVDLGVIDSDGFHRAYVGPYNLKGLNYYDQPWFSQVMSKGTYISDVFMGFRRLPHFIIAVRHQEDQHSWILRATIDPDILRDIVRSAKVGQTGDAFIVSRSGVYQTRPRFHGEVLWNSQIDTSLFGGRTTVTENNSPQGRKLLVAGSWLKNNDWLLVISQEAHEEMGGLFATRNIEIVIMALGILAIVLATVFTTGLTVRSLEAAHQKMDELNAQLMQSDKLAALGKMAAGIAHEINNPLAVIGEKAGWMRDLLSEEEFQNSENLKEYQKSIEKIDEHVERVRKITHNMLGFARRMEPHLDDVDVNAVLNQTLELLQNHARINNIDIKKDLQTDLPVIASDQSQLQQVFLNLVNNAIDAIGKDGTIDIVTRRTDQKIEVNIKDDGPGIPKELQRRIFDPFFTTKQTGKGTGLGLSISYSIIEKMGGTINFSSKEGAGTEFRIFLPIQSPAKK